MLENCPVCNGNLRVSQVYCELCGTTVSGQLGLPASHFQSLSEEQIHFVLTFLRCEGKFNRMEDELSLSYPTLKNRLAEILSLLGLDSEKASDNKGLSKADRINILKKLDQGVISPEEAEKILSRNGFATK